MLISDKCCWLVFVFLRLVVAIHICSHGDEYEQIITGLNVNRTLKDVSISISSLTLLPRAEFQKHPFLDTQSFILPDPLLSLQTVVLSVRHSMQWNQMFRKYNVTAQTYFAKTPLFLKPRGPSSSR